MLTSEIIELIDDQLGFSGGVVAAEPAGELYYQNELGSPQTVSQLDPALAAMELNDAALPPASESIRGWP